LRIVAVKYSKANTQQTLWKILFQPTQFAPKKMALHRNEGPKRLLAI